MKTSVRVRFAPSPTGMMHLGNVRAALMNYLFAQQKNGTFIIRIEDTDPQRNFDPGAQHILADLQWLGLSYQEGPLIGGPHEPYFQSERTPLYQEKLQELATKKLVYRCFCTTEELEAKRQRQIALKKAPRYDRTCLNLSEQEIERKCAAQIPYIWRVKVAQEGVIYIDDMGHGKLTFDLKNFSDFPITRADGSFTFIFANFVDDMLMEITHVVRGEDHLTNTANQVVLYQAFNKPLPTFWHLPIIINAEGKKLSKRDFGFSLTDLRTAGFLAEAIDNYLAIIGGSFEQEIMSLEELAQKFNFEKMNSSGHIRYDAEKLRWLNKKWLARIDAQALTNICLPFLQKAFPHIAQLDTKIVTTLLQAVKTELVTTQDCVQALRFYFEAPAITIRDIAQIIPSEPMAHALVLIMPHLLTDLANPEAFLTKLKELCKEHTVPIKEAYAFVRFALTGSATGPGIKDLLVLLGAEESEKRFKRFLSQN